MAQAGLHGLIGLALTQIAGQDAKGYDKDRVGRFKWGFVVGNMLPDIDLLLVLPLLPFLKSDTLAVVHRTFTHSLVTQGVLCLLYYFFWARRNPQRQGLVTGLWLGMLVHSATDMFLWMSHVDLMWPLGVFGLKTDFNAWVNLQLLPIPGNLLGAAEFLVIGLYFRYLTRIARISGQDLRMLPSLGRAEWLMYALFLVSAVLAFFLAPGLHTLVTFPVVGLVGIPMLGWFVWHMRESIAWAPPLLRQTAA